MNSNYTGKVLKFRTPTLTWKLSLISMETFVQQEKNLHEQAQKALYALFIKTKNISIPIDLQLKLFDSLVAPVLLYASEVWGFEDKTGTER